MCSATVSLYYQSTDHSSAAWVLADPGTDVFVNWIEIIIIVRIYLAYFINILFIKMTTEIFLFKNYMMRNPVMNLWVYYCHWRYDLW